MEIYVLISTTVLFGWSIFNVIRTDKRLDGLERKLDALDDVVNKLIKSNNNLWDRKLAGSDGTTGTIERLRKAVFAHESRIAVIETRTRQ